MEEHAGSGLDTCPGIGHLAVGMARQRYDLQLTRYDDRGWRAIYFASGMEHSPTSATGTAWEVRSKGIMLLIRNSGAVAGLQEDKPGGIVGVRRTFIAPRAGRGPTPRCAGSRAHRTRWTTPSAAP